MPKIKVKKAAAKKVGKKRVIRVKRKSNTNINKNSVRVNSLPVSVPFGALAGGSSGGGGGSSSSTVTVVPVPSNIQTAGVVDSTSKDDFRTLRNEIHEGIAGGFNALSNHWNQAPRGGDWPSTSDYVPAQADVATVMTNDIGANQPQEVPMDIGDVNPPAQEATPPVPAAAVGASPLRGIATEDVVIPPPATAGNRALRDGVTKGQSPNPLNQQPPAQGVRQQTEFERLMERQRMEAAQRARLADEMNAARNNADARDGMVVGNLRIPKRKVIPVPPREARGEQSFIDAMTADTIANRDQMPDFVQSQYTGNAALGIYGGRARNDRFEKSSRLDAAGNAFEVDQRPQLPPLRGGSTTPQIMPPAQPLFEEEIEEDL
jgi:hypothetical protein